MCSFIYDDGGRKDAGYKGSTNDCVVRAISIISGLSYKEVYNDINHLAKQSKSNSSARNDVSKKIFHSYLYSLGFKWVPLMGIGTGCKVHLNEKELPKGKLICRCSKHLVAVIDGVIHDTYNPNEKVSYCWKQDKYFEPSDRCVYGYYTR